ncbi:hypothetical protein [Pseudomonas sp. NPDC089406]|uniref:hypothetical protein n=1 Tax=Pseudomonas sp. NPDC089406 TaxID=3364463 RepID=UPI00384BB74E
MDESRLDTSKSFIADLYLIKNGTRCPIRISDSGWLQVMQGQVLPTTLWFGCYQLEDGEGYIIKEYTKGGSQNGSVLSLNHNDYLGFYADAQRIWAIHHLDGRELVPRGTPEASVSISTKGGRRWTASGNDVKALKGAGSELLVHIHKIGVYRF